MVAILLVFSYGVRNPRDRLGSRQLTMLLKIDAIIDVSWLYAPNFTKHDLLMPTLLPNLPISPKNRE
jgi:hypothetical protein